MSWLSSFGTAVLSAAFGLVCGGFTGQLCVGWYRVTSFEGRSGYFVIASALAGGVAAFVIGLVVARFMAGGTPSFLKVLGAALGAVLVVALATLALCRLFAERAPTSDGENVAVVREPDPDAQRAQSFAALAPDAPLASWLPYLFESPSDARTRVVLQRIEERQSELAELIRSPDARLREFALQATKYPREPAAEVIEAVRAEGRAIADGVRAAGAWADGDPRFDAQVRELVPRFRAWRDAWWGLCARLPLDGAPPLREIFELAREHSDSSAMRDIALDAQFVVDALAKSAAEKKP